MIRETITFTFENEEQQKRFHQRLKGGDAKHYAKIVEDLAANQGELLLRAGEMTAAEMRTSKAVLRLAAHLIRQEKTMMDLASETQKLGGMGY